MALELFVISAALPPAVNLKPVNRRHPVGTKKAAHDAPPRISARLKVDGRGFTLLATLQLEADRLTLIQGLHPGALNGRNVDEHVLGAVCRLNETKTLLGVEPLNCT